MANFKIPYGSKKHQKIRDAIRARVKLSEASLGKKEGDYDKDEEIYQIYMPETDADLVRKSSRDAGKPKYTTLTIPYSYATLLTAHTYWVSVFLSRSPIMQYMARHGESKTNVQAIEALIDYQVNVGQNLAPLYIWLLDPGQYGLGALGCYWDEEITTVAQIVEEPASYLGIPLLGKTVKKMERKRIKGYAGNKLYNIRIHDLLVDPRVSILNFQEGEFCGRKFDMGWNQVQKRRASGHYQNIDALERVVKSGAPRGVDGQRSLGSGKIDLPIEMNNDSATLNTMDLLAPDRVSGVEMCVELIPRDWELGDSGDPEKWVFTLANDEVIIEAQPYDYWHGKFPFQILQYEIEGYGINKRSMLEIIQPLQDTMDWLVNTHFFNVRQVLNGQAIYDPSRLVGKDFKTTEPGRLIRMQPSAYGQDVRSMYHQIQTVDVTQNHMRDTQLVQEMIQRVTGVTDNLMGMVNPGGRKTATEVRTSSSAGANRMKTQAEYFSATGFSPLAQMMLQNTQQRYDLDKQFRIAGDLMSGQEGMLKVTPEMISGFYDFIPVDGTMPIDRFAQVSMWSNLMAQMRNYPQIMQQYNVGGIFGWIAKLGGLKNIDQFKINITPDGQIPGQVQGGNLVPIGGVDGGGTRPGGTPGTGGPIPGAGQVSGMGPSG
jgi:hypothetical protein